jgi:hypothetical protein
MLFGVGLLTAGGASAIGSGAFSSVSAKRTMSVGATTDAQSFLTLQPYNGPGGYGSAVEKTGGTIKFDFDDELGTGDGLGTDSMYEFDRVFEVVNKGTQSINMWLGSVKASGIDSPLDVELYRVNEHAKPLDGINYYADLPVGDVAIIGIRIDTHGVGIDQTLQVALSIVADADDPSGKAVGSNSS